MIHTGKIKRVALWLSRIRHVRGFGVQSPWAYSLVRYVINERYPYYAYDSLAEKWRSEGRERQRLAELVMRLANHVQSDRVIIPANDNGMLMEYVKAGCRKTETERYCENTSLETSHRLIILSAETTPHEWLRTIINTIPDHTFILLTDMRLSNESKTLWKEIISTTKDVQTFDLFHHGLIYKDSKRYKQHYKINF